jgi:hypothetical protein
MEDQVEVLVPEFPEQDEKCSNCGCECSVWEGRTGTMKYCAACGYSELL